MKKSFLIILSALLCFFNSCRETEDFGATENQGGQFGFSVLKDQNFPETFVGDETAINFKIVPNYDFTSIKTYFKFGTTQNGTLKFNDQIVSPNNQYEFTSSDNVFKYIGDVEGDHTINFEVYNEKGVSQAHTISVDLRNPKVSFVTTPIGNIMFSHSIIPASSGFPGGLKIFQNYFSRNFKVKTEGSSSITHITYSLSYEITAPGNNSFSVTKNYSELLPPNTNEIEVNGNFNTNSEFLGTVMGWSYFAQNKKIEIEVFNNFGQSAVSEFNP